MSLASRQTLGVMVALCTLLAAPCTTHAAEEPVLNVYNWADYMDPKIIEAFEKEYGIKVNYDEYDSSETVEAKLLAGNSGYDVVDHSAQYSSRLIPINIYAKLDKRALTNWETLNPEHLEMLAYFDPGNQHGSPYTWGSTGFAYNVDMIRERMPNAPVDSGDMIFKPEIAAKFADCGISFLDSPTDVIPMALVYLGYDANSSKPEEIREAEKLLKGVRPYIKYFSSTRMLNDLPNKEVCIAMSWSGDYLTAKDRASEAGVEINLAYSVPREGSVFWFDALFIPSDAPHPKNALLFINYMLRPEVLAAASNFVSYATATRDGYLLVKERLRNDPAVYPTPEIMEVLHPNKALPPKQERLRTRAWANFKTGM